MTKKQKFFKKNCIPFIVFLLLFMQTGCETVNKYGLSHVKHPKNKYIYNTAPIWHANEQKFYFIKVEIPYVIGFVYNHNMFAGLGGYSPKMGFDGEIRKAKCFLIEVAIEKNIPNLIIIDTWNNKTSRYPRKEDIIERLEKKEIAKENLYLVPPKKEIRAGSPDKIIFSAPNSFWELVYERNNLYLFGENQEFVIFEGRRD